MSRYAMIAVALLVFVGAAHSQEPAPKKEPLKKPIAQVLVCEVGSCRAELVSGSTGPLEYTRKLASGKIIDQTAADDYLILKVRITNDVGIKTVNFTPWHTARVKASMKPAAHDEQGKSLKPWISDSDQCPIGAVKSPTQIKPDAFIIDVVAFVAPSRDATMIFVMLPADNAGKPGEYFRFKIARGFFETPEQTKANLAQKEADEKRSKQQALAKAKAIKEKKEQLAEKAKADKDDEEAVERAAKEAIVRRETLKAANTVSIGDFEIQVTSSKLAIVPLFDDIRNVQRESKEEKIIISIAIANKSETRLGWYESWQGKDFSLTRDFASLHDEFKNVYPRITFGFGIKVVGQKKGRIRLEPNGAIADDLVFDPPIAAAKDFTLTLPAGNLGEKNGRATIRLPRWFLLGDTDPEIAKKGK